MHEIFTHFISRDPKDDGVRVGYIMWFSDSFPISEFSGEERIMKYYCDYSARLQVPMKAEYFDTFMSTELKKILIKDSIRVPGTDNVSFSDPAGVETAFRVTREFLQNEFRILESYESNIEDFRVAADAFMSQKLSDRTVEELSNTYETLSKSDNTRDSVEYALDSLLMLREIYSTDVLEEINDTAKETEQFKFLMDFGIPVIDSDIGGLYTSQLFGIEAQPGTGKTRFSLGVVAYRAAVLYHENVIYYQLEQSVPEARAMLTARHVYTLYKIQMSDDMILRGKVPKEYQAKVKAAEIDLFESGKYGKIFIKNGDLYEDTLTQTLRKDDKLHGPFDIVIIDYLGLIERKETTYAKRKEKYMVIGDACRKIKRYVQRTRKAALCISQFNQEGIDAGLNDKEITPGMAEGGIAVYKHSDQNLALSRTLTMKLQQKLKISQPKIRGTAGFGSAIIDTRLGFCYFYQNTTSNV